MLVAVHVSSMNTKRSGSRSTWLSNQSWRCLRTSGRSCSMACPVFFCALCPAGRRSGAARQPILSDPLRPRQYAALRARCPCAPPTRPECRTLAPPRGGIVCRRLAALERKGRSQDAAPASEWLSIAQPKASRRSSATQPAINRRQKPRAQIHGERVTHPCRPLSPAQMLNRKSERTEIPHRFRTVETVPSGCSFKKVDPVELIIDQDPGISVFG